MSEKLKVGERYITDQNEEGELYEYCGRNDSKVHIAISFGEHRCVQASSVRPATPPQPYRPKPGDNVLVEAGYLKGYETGWPVLKLPDGLIVVQPLTAIRPLHAGQEGERW